MAKKSTEKFVRNNRGLLRDVAQRGDPLVRPLATAFLVAVPPEDEDIGAPEKENPDRSNEDSDEFDENSTRRWER